MSKILRASVVWLVIVFSLMGSSARAATPQLAASFLSKGWTKTWGGPLGDGVHTSAIDSSNNLYVIGEFAGTVDFDPDPDKTDEHISVNNTIDAFLAKYAPDGTFVWARTWGGSGGQGRDVANGLAIDSAGNIYVSGPFQNKVDFNPDRDIIVERQSNAGSMNNIYLSKFSPDGVFQWVKTWGPSDAGGESYTLAYDGANAIYVAGDFSGIQPTNFNPWDSQNPDPHLNHQPIVAGANLYFDSFLSKFDLNGNFQWAKTWGGEGYDDGPGVAVDHNGYVYVAGMYASKVIDFDPAGSGVTNHPANDSGHVVDVFLSKFDSNGIFQWVKTWGGPGVDDAGGTLLVDGDNNVIVMGRFGCTGCDFNPGGTPDLRSSNGDLDAFITKIDSTGAYEWTRTWGGSGWDAVGGFTVDGENNIYTTGFFVNTVTFNPGENPVVSKGGRDIFFNKFTPDGKYLWTKTWGGSGDDFGARVVLDGANNVYVAGSYSTTVDFDPGLGQDFHPSNGLSDAFISKFSPIPLSPVGYLPWIIR